MLVVGVLERVIQLRIADVMGAALIHEDPALLAQAIDAESRQEEVEDAGVVSVLGILGVEFPIVGQYLGAAAENTGRAVQHTANPAGDLRPKIVLDIGNVVAE